VGGLCRQPIGALLVASAIVVGCDDSDVAGVECSDPLGGELHGVFTPSTQPPITLGIADPMPTMFHIDATTEHPSATYLRIGSNGAYFQVVLAGEALETTAFVDMYYVGEGKVAIIESCPQRTPREYRRVSGTAAMSFNGQAIEGWFNAWYQPLEDW
jgi:hypothetical protein